MSDAAAASSRRRWPRKALLTIAVALLGVLYVALLGVLVASGRDPAATRTCDQAVATLLTTHDAIDLERARILIHELDCGVFRRLPK